MPENSRLSDFAVDETPPDAESAAGDPTPEGDARDVAPEGARATSAYAPAGGPCAVCGATVERRYRADAGLVCPDCKAW